MFMFRLKQAHTLHQCSKGQVNINFLECYRICFVPEETLTGRLKAWNEKDANLNWNVYTTVIKPTRTPNFPMTFSTKRNLYFSLFLIPMHFLVQFLNTVRSLVIVFYDAFSQAQRHRLCFGVLTGDCVSLSYVWTELVYSPASLKRLATPCSCLCFLLVVMFISPFTLHGYHWSLSPSLYVNRLYFLPSPLCSGVQVVSSTQPWIPPPP